MKKRFLGKISMAMALATTVICSYTANGQPANYVAPSAIPYIYPGGGGQPPTSCFAYGGLLFNGSPRDPYVSAWGDRIVWRIAAPGSSTSFGPQGQFTIPGASGMKVTMFNPGVPYICAVYKLGGDFYMRLYMWNSVTFVSGPAIPLTTLNAAGSRISVDVYGLGVVGIVWDEINANTLQPELKCKFSYGGTAFTGNYTLAGTSGQTNPDIAMTRTGTPSPSYLNNNTVHAHIVALSGPPAARVITEYGIPVEDIIASNPAVNFTPFIEDTDNLGYLELNPIPSIDCPDFDYNFFYNWAYTYVRDGDICARFADYNAGTINTAVLTDGSMGNAPITLSAGLYYANYEPTITYNNTATSVFIGWRHSLYPVLQNIATCVEVSTDGSTLISPVDYLYVNSSQLSSAPVFSKHTMSASYLYANTLELPASAANMTHYFHNWANTNFKPGAGSGINNPMFTGGKIEIYPNPVADNIKVNIPATLAHQILNVAITDVLGKIIYSSSCASEQLGSELSKALVGKASGTYLLRVEHKSSGYSQEEKLVKIR